MWGHLESKQTEIVQKSFIKRLFRLPSNTPNYVLYIETNFEKIFFHTLRRSLEYILRTLALSETRLPLKLSRQIIKNNISWSKEWKAMGRRCGISTYLLCGF